MKAWILMGAILIFLEACVATEKPSQDFLRMLHRTLNEKIESGKIHFGAAYHKIGKIGDTIDREYNSTGETIKYRYIDTSYLYYPFFFLENGKMAYYDFITPDSVRFNKKHRLYGKKAYSWGVYEIKADTIKAIFYFMYYQRSRTTPTKHFQTYFEGIIKGKDSILNWRMVPPYPLPINPNSLWNRQNLEAFMTPKNLGFKKVNVQFNFDTLWIDRFKDKKYNYAK